MFAIAHLKIAPQHQGCAITSPTLRVYVSAITPITFATTAKLALSLRRHQAKSGNKGKTFLVLKQSN
jgi:hypothetical protein